MACRKLLAVFLCLAAAGAALASLETPPEARPAAKVDALAAAVVEAPADADAALARGEAVELIVTFKDAAVSDALAAAVKSKVVSAVAAASAGGARVTADYTHMPVSVVSVASAAALAALRADASVAGVAPVGRHTRALLQSAPLINQPAAAARGATGEGCAVVIIDGGGNYGAADLGSCASPGAPAPCRVAVAQDMTSENAFTTGDAHSTNVASIVAKLAPSAKIIMLDVFKGQYAYDSDILAAINWAVANKAKYGICSINLSLGDSGKNAQRCPGSPYEPAFAAARAAGILPAVASGNEYYQNAISSPACAPSAVSVGAVHDSNHGAFDSCDTATAADKVACFSNVAPWLDLLAPGSAITAGGWTMSGTSMASPHVAAAAAVLLAASPASSVAQVVAALKSAGKPVTEATSGATFPRIDIDAALASLTGAAPGGGGGSGTGGGSAGGNGSGSGSGAPAVPVLRATLSINGGAASTPSPRVKLAVAPAAGVSADGLQMCVSNGADCSAYVPFAATLSWLLDRAAAGPKTVSVWLKDAAGKVSPVPASATIGFALGADTAPPADVGSVTATVDDALTSMRLKWDPAAATDDVTGVAKFVVVYKAGGYPPAGCATNKKGVLLAPVPEGGDVSEVTVTGLRPRRTYRFRVCAVDYAGNVSEGATGFASTKKRRSSRLLML